MDIYVKSTPRRVRKEGLIYFDARKGGILTLVPENILAPFSLKVPLDGKNHYFINCRNGFDIL